MQTVALVWQYGPAECVTLADVIQRAIELGVDGIISDDPLTLIAIAKRNGLR